jgi:hypothetical protein
MIQILNQRYPHNGQFMGAMSKRYLDGGFSLPADLTHMDLKMVFTISKQRDYQKLNVSSSRFSPADRIEYLKFSLEIPPEYNLDFSGWNRYTTEYGEIEIADVSFSTSLDLEMDRSVKETDAGGKTSFSRSEQQEVRARYLKLNGSINNKIISVEEEGTREIDLTGNVIADVSLEFEGFPERIAFPQFAGEHSPLTGKVSLTGFSFADVMVPRMEEAPDTLTASLTFDYVYRHVQSGDKTFVEWDDQVEYYTGKVNKQIPLFLKRDYIPGFYCIGSERDPNKQLKIKDGGDKEYLLQFVNYQDARRVVEYLYGLEGAIPGEVLIFGKVSILFEGKTLSQKQAAQGKWKVMPVYE